MGLVHAELTLINAHDVALAKEHVIGKEEIKSMVLSMPVDSGGYMMAGNETIQSQLELPFY